MGRNVEIKARASDFERQQQIAAKIAESAPQGIAQEDTFFHCSTGRLKLRKLGSAEGELIAYTRADAAGPKQSQYEIALTDDPDQLEQVLASALGRRGVVRKKRTLYLVGQTRIHFDEVEGLGRFIELEVVLLPNQDRSEGQRIAQRLMDELGIVEDELISGAYLDMGKESNQAP